MWRCWGRTGHVARWWRERRWVECMCVASAHDWQDLRIQTHMQTHTNEPLDVTPPMHSRDLIPSLSCLCIRQVAQWAIRRRKGEKHEQRGEQQLPFEVVFLLGSSFSVTWLVKQIIKCNGLGGLGSFISEGKNKVFDDLGGFWSWTGWGFPSLLEQFTSANRQVLASSWRQGINTLRHEVFVG